MSILDTLALLSQAQDRVKKLAASQHKTAFRFCVEISSSGSIDMSFSDGEEQAHLSGKLDDSKGMALSELKYATVELMRAVRKAFGLS